MFHSISKRLLLTCLIQLICVVILVGGTLYCSSDSSDDESSGPSDWEETLASLNLDNQCYACGHEIAEGDTCGSEMIMGTASRFAFDQDGLIISLNINNQIRMSGTYEEGYLNLAKEHVSYIGPGCNKYFDDVSLTARIRDPGTIKLGWVGILIYNLGLSDEADCDSFSFVACRAVHTVTCLPRNC